MREGVLQAARMDDAEELLGTLEEKLLSAQNGFWAIQHPSPELSEQPFGWYFTLSPLL